MWKMKTEKVLNLLPYGRCSRIRMALQKRKASKPEKGSGKIRKGIFLTEKKDEIPRRLFCQFQNRKPDRAVLKKKIFLAVQHGRGNGISLTKSINSLYTGKIFPQNTQNKEDAILGVRENGICMSTAFTDDSGNTNILIDCFSMNDIDNGTPIGGMGFTVT